MTLITPPRRALLQAGFAAASFAIVSRARAENEKEGGQAEEVTPPEDLMREHGVLDRVLFIYEAAIRRLSSNEDFDPLPFADAFAQIWSLSYAHGTLYAGAKPANLLAGENGDKNWVQINALTDHPSADTWNPGGAGLVLHTIVSDPGDPKKLWVGISAAGVFATEDGGATWERRNRLSNAEACGHNNHPAGPRDGEIGYCIHNMMRAPGTTDVLYQQNHYGVWRSADGGRSWEDRTKGLPSTFGFPIRVHPRDPNIIWTLPLNGDMAGRFPPDAAASVWRSRDGGQSWQAMRQGLPQQGRFFTVLRQAMAGDDRDPAGIYFGTNSGSVFASFDEGENWREIAHHLPTILAVEAVDLHV